MSQLDGSPHVLLDAARGGDRDAREAWLGDQQPRIYPCAMRMCGDPRAVVEVLSPAVEAASRARARSGARWLSAARGATRSYGKRFTGGFATRCEPCSSSGAAKSSSRDQCVRQFVRPAPAQRTNCIADGPTARFQNHQLPSATLTIWEHQLCEVT